MPVKRFACTEDIPSILAIWRSGFPDDGEKTALDFLKTVELKEECLLALEDGKPVSMVFMLPCTLYGFTGEKRPVQYIYAAATLEDYRGRGVFRDLLQEALKIGKTRGQAGSFLRPAEKGLEGYYATFGYAPFFYTRIHTVLVADWLDANLRVTPADMVSAAKYASLRERCLVGKTPHISWENRFVTYAVHTAGQAGGGAVSFAFPEGAACALYDHTDSLVTVRELLCPPGRENACLKAIVLKHSCELLQWRGPANRKVSSEIFGLWKPFKPLDAKNRFLEDDRLPYMGLSLD